MNAIAEIIAMSLITLLGVALVALIGVIVFDALKWHPVKAIRRFWGTTQLRPKNRPSPMAKAVLEAQEAKTAIENNRHTKRVRNREDAERWRAEFTELDPVPIRAKPTSQRGHLGPSVRAYENGDIKVVSMDGGVRIHKRHIPCRKCDAIWKDVPLQ